MRNFIETENPFGLPTPPLFFLEGLLLQDPELVLFPSVEQPVYRVHRKLNRTSSTRWSEGMMQSHPDLLTAAQLGGPKSSVFSIQHHGLLDWGKVLLDICSRDTWRVHDPASVLDTLDELERNTMFRDTESEVDQRARDGWALFQARTGARVSLAYSVPHGGQTTPEPSPHALPYRPTGSGPSALFTGR